MRAVENVRFHPRQILQPGEDFSAVEELSCLPHSMSAGG